MTTKDWIIVLAQCTWIYPLHGRFTRFYSTDTNLFARQLRFANSNLLMDLPYTTPYTANELFMQILVLQVAER